VDLKLSVVLELIFALGQLDDDLRIPRPRPLCAEGK
jgi:hypothetical protein